MLKPLCALTLLVAADAWAASCFVTQPITSLDEPVRFDECTTPPPRPAGGCSEGMKGVTFSLDLEGRRATVWAGVDSERTRDTIAVQTFSAEGAPAVCTTHTPLENVNVVDGLSVKPWQRSPLPLIDVSGFGLSTCHSYSGGLTVACFLLSNRCEILKPWREQVNLRDQCRQGPEPTPEEKAREEAHVQGNARAEDLYRRAREALKKKDVRTAEALLMEAAPRSYDALTDLHAFYLRQQRFADAERALLLKADWGFDHTGTMLELADFYWARGKRRTASELYREHIRLARMNVRKGEVARIVPRAKQRAAKEKPSPTE